MDKKSQEFLMQPILFKCPFCSVALSCTIAQLGEELTCKNCNKNIKISNQLLYDEDFEKEFPEIAKTAREILSHKS